jgi:hypothetical protein
MTTMPAGAGGVAKTDVARVASDARQAKSACFMRTSLCVFDVLIVAVMPGTIVANRGRVGEKHGFLCQPEDPGMALKTTTT